MSRTERVEDAAAEPRLAPRDLDLSSEEKRVMATVLDALRRIEHGSVQLIVQDRRVVQIDTVEKTRLGKLSSP